MTLAKALLQSRPDATLFCVGDDWQSIFRFTGSDITLTSRFHEHFGHTRVTVLDRTFRFNNKLSEFTSTFVMKNPAQIKKTLTTVATSDSPAITLVQHEPEANSTAIEYCLEDIRRRAKEGALIYCIGRYHHDCPANLHEYTRRFPGLTFRFDTAHISKGQEADFVIVLNVNDGRLGWPSQMEDDPLLQLVLPDEEPYPFAEERRLFYVAVTRARHHTYLLSDVSAPSVFVQEILDGRNQGYEFNYFVTEGGREEHAAVVRLIFQAVLAAGTPTRAARWLRDRGIVLPAFGPDVALEDVQRSSLVRHRLPQRGPGGFLLTPALIRSVATNPVYLGWWLVAGRVVSTDNHPPIVEEDTFLLAQQVLADHGRRPTSGAGVRSGRSQLLSGLLWCTRHEVPQRMTGSRVKAGGRYQCDDSYDHGQTDHHCTLLDARVLDVPVTDVVLRQCQFLAQAEAVLVQLETEYKASREDTRRRQRERRQLQQELETLQQNLALTRTPEQVAMLFAQIERRQHRLAALADTQAAPDRRVLSAAHAATVRAFLADLRTGWEGQPAALRNEFLRLILERVLVHARRDSVEATIVWRAGVTQRLWIERPLHQRGGKARWTEGDNAWLRAWYGAATAPELRERFPDRSAHAVRKQAELLGLKRPQRGVPKPKGTPWSAGEDALLQAYAAGAMSQAALCAQLPGRSWDAITSQGRALGLRFRQDLVYYHVVDDNREIIYEEDSLRML
jgi:hypothetical protein